MSAATGRKRTDETKDHDNPEWTKADFARAVGPEGLSAAELAAFPMTKVGRGRPKIAEPKKPTTIRLSREVLEHFQAGGKGWQGRIDDALKEVVASKRG